MKTQDYSTSIITNVSAAKAFNSINNIMGWWTTIFEGQSEKVDDIFTVRFGETFITIKITAFIPHQKIGWQVIDSYKHWLSGNRKEWQNTSMHWEIVTVSDTTTINFTHVGLVPSLECYGGCEKGWNHYIKESLFKLLTEGKGKPELK